LEAEIEKLKRLMEKENQRVETQKVKIKEQEDLLKGVLKKKDRLEADLDKLNASLSADRRTIAESEDRFRRKQVEIEQMEEQLNQFSELDLLRVRNDAALKQRTAVDKALEELKKRDIDEEQALKLLSVAKIELTRDLDRLKSVDNVRIATLDRLDKLPMRAREIVARNRNLFEENVYGPVCLELEIADEMAAKYLENSISSNFLKGFVVSTRNDRETFIKLLYDENNIRVHVLLNETKGRKKDFHDMLVPLRSKGVLYSLGQLVKTNDVIFNMLVDTSNIDQFCVVDDSAIQYFAKCEMPPNVYFHKEKLYKVIQSKYGDRDMSTSSRTIHDARSSMTFSRGRRGLSTSTRS